MEGDVLNQPAPRPLDLFACSINSDEEIIVDTGSPIERENPGIDQIVFPEAGS